MFHRLSRFLTACATVVVVAACADQQLPTSTNRIDSPLFAISDAATGGTAEFFWLPPTVASAPGNLGAFDASALGDLTIEICKLTNTTCSGGTIQSIDATTLPASSRLRLNGAGEFYEATWLTGPSGVRAGESYRVSVLRGGEVLGFIDAWMARNMPEARNVDRSRYTAIVKGQQFPIRFRLDQLEAQNHVRVNEIESNGGTPGDWVELFNGTNTAFDLGGYILMDNADDHLHVIPAGTMIPANGFLVLDELTGPTTEGFDFGLGTADNVRLFAPNGTTLVDNHEWSGGHAATTLARCPDGTGEFQVASISTKGLPNDCGLLVLINEIESSGGTPGDWIELYNPNGTAVNVGGHVITDSDPTHTYAIPAGTSIPANGFLTLDEATFGFGLGGADDVHLYRPNGVVEIDSYTWATHAATTYGRCPDGGGFVTTTASTRNTANACPQVATGIVFNEVESNGDATDWVELVNTGNASVDLSGYLFRDNDDNEMFILPAGSVIQAGGFLVIDQGDGTTGFTFGLGGNDMARLYSPGGGILIASYAWAAHAATTYGRCPDGSGEFVTTTSGTKGTANACPTPGAGIVWNEVESNGDPVGDWAELYNAGAAPVDLSGFGFRDNDVTHARYILPAGTIVPAGGYLVLTEAQFGFGLGGADEVQLYAPNNGALIISYGWASHAATTYGRCPNGTGPLTTTNSSTQGITNDCGVAVRINEVESSGGTPGDWVELYNAGGSTVNIGGFQFVDNDATHTKYVIPAGTMLPAGGYYVLDEAQFSFGLGGNDAATLYGTDGTTVIDSYTWTTAATTTYGRCPNGSGVFITTQVATKGTVNSCPGDLIIGAWPGDAAASEADIGGGQFGGDMSGLAYQASGTSAPGILWASQNSGAIWKFNWDGSNGIWTPDAAWAGGKPITYLGGAGIPDAEGITFVGTALYVGAERNNNANSVSRNSIVRFDGSSPVAALSATHEWNLTADLPTVGANLGVEAITYVPDAWLTARGFIDESTGQLFNPANYPDHAGGVFFVAMEAGGNIYGFVLNHTTSTFTRVATISSGYESIMGLEFDPAQNQIWAICDNTCNGRAVMLLLDQAGGSPTLGKFITGLRFERPAGLPNGNNEGFAVAAAAECSSNRRPAFWSNDDETGGYALWKGTVSCTGF